MSFTLSTRDFPNSKQFGSVFIKTNSENRLYIKDNDHLFFLKGEVFTPTNNIKDLAEIVIKDGFEKIICFNGEFSLLHYNRSSKEVQIGNDILGREGLFYYNVKGLFIISDNFWELIDIVRPDAEDINKQGVFESVLLERPLNFATIINSLLFFPSASIGKYYFENQKFSINTYWDFKYQPDIHLDQETAIERLDSAFRTYTHKLADLYSQETKFLIGLSGGLDSRLVAAYGNEVGLRQIGFIIGEKRPHGFFLSRDYANAYALARHFNMDLFELPYDKTPYFEKIILEAKYFPLHQARLFHTQNIDTIPQYDVLLNGLMGGESFGSEIREESLKLKPFELSTFLLQQPMFRGKTHYTRKSTLVKRGFQKVFDNKPSNLLAFDTFLRDNCRLEIFHQEIKDFVDHEVDQGKSNLDIIQKLLFYNISNGKYGSFCMYPEKPNHSIMPILFQETLDWPQEFLINKKLQNEFFLRKHKEISKIPAQDNLVPIFYRQNPGLRKQYYQYMHIIRGTSILSHRTFAYRNDYLEFTKSVFEIYNPIIDSLFNTQKFLQLETAPAENLLKVKYILDIILNKDFQIMLS